MAEDEKAENYQPEQLIQRIAELESVVSRLQQQNCALLSERSPRATVTRAEQTPGHQNDFLNHVLESLTHPFYVINADDYSVVMANSAAKRANSVIQKCHDTPGDKHLLTWPNFARPIEEIKRTGKPVTIEHVEEQELGQTKHLEIHAYPVFDSKGEVVQVLEYVLDITERKHMEQALRDSETRLRSVAQSAIDAIISVNSEDKIIFWNSGAQRIFGYREEEILGKPVITLIPDQYKAAHSRGVKKYLSGGRPQLIGRTAELQGLRKDGQEFPLELSLSTWRAQGKLYFTGIIRDISDRKEAENALARTTEEVRHRKEELESLIQMVAHDLKSPVITIAGLVRNLKAKLSLRQDDEKIRAILHQLASSGETMERFLTDLLDGMALEGTEPQRTLLKMEEVVSEVIQEHRHLIDEKGIEISPDFKTSEICILADKRRIKQVFDNLLTNAIRYMQNTRDPKIWISLQADARTVTAAVCDNGVGIAPEYQARIFDQFFRIPDSSAQKGTGLGLSIVKKIVEIHGGKIWCESPEGCGAKFIFTLPRRLHV
jgi:PAS domain S-box-containing protein